MSNTSIAANLIDGVLAGELSSEAALDQWPDSSKRDKALLNAVWATLQHFCDDEDIHRVDTEYLESERSKLKEFASRLRTHVGTNGD